MEAVEGVDNHPDPCRRRVVVERVREHFENPSEAAEEEESEVEDASEGDNWQLKISHENHQK